MSHNISVSNSPDHVASGFKASVEADNDMIPSASWRIGGRPVLTVVDALGREVDIMVNRDGIVINPWSRTGKIVSVKGEDLFALRELLAEIDEDAFVRPADPVAEYTVLKDGDGDWWVEQKNGLFGCALVFGQAITYRPLSSGGSSLDDIIQGPGLCVDGILRESRS